MSGREYRSSLDIFTLISVSHPRYTAGSGNTGSCEYDFNGMPPSVGLTGYQILEANNQDAVMQHLAEVGPLAVAVYARCEYFNDE